MNISQEYFLLVAQELNISHAAQKLAISQQGLSSHIRRLEESYGVKLFQRTPKLRLTAAGEKLVRALNRIKLIESGLAVELAQDTGSESGIVRIGLHPSRAFLLAPLVLPVFQKKFPAVRIDIENGSTRQFERRLLASELDCFVGVNPVRYSQFQILPLAEERFYAVMSANLFDEAVGGRHLPEEFREGLTLEQMALFPFIATSSYSSMGVYDAEWFSQIPRARIAASTSVISVIFDLIRADYAAGVLSTLHLYNFICKCQNDSQRYYFFPIAPFAQKNRLFIVHHREYTLPDYLKKLFDVMRAQVEQFIKNGERDAASYAARTWNVLSV